jgi:hypothetical protein
LELLVNSIAGLLILIFDGARSVVERSNKALLAPPAVTVGAYVGTRSPSPASTAPSPSIAEH